MSEVRDYQAWEAEWQRLELEGTATLPPLPTRDGEPCPRDPERMKRGRKVYRQFEGGRRPQWAEQDAALPVIEPVPLRVVQPSLWNTLRYPATWGERCLRLAVLLLASALAACVVAAGLLGVTP